MSRFKQASVEVLLVRRELEIRLLAAKQAFIDKLDRRIAFLRARDSGRLPEAEDTRSVAECEASQSGPGTGHRPNTGAEPRTA